MPTDVQRLAAAVARLNRRLRQERHSELTPSQLSLLGTLRELGTTTPGAIAAHEKVRPPSITRALSCLQDEGLVRRETHPDDGRQVLVSVSEEGERVLAEERGRRDAWLHVRLRELDARERAVLREAAAIMTRLAAS
ncbi:MAG: MarR family transcriptional regulator [Aeromicrobium sp.]|uniref:MarR family winged helix-turn-helix transcriptional regulator n=1 Tax=Aeromicrobium sp. TaxID=1871063 RepID=UPI0039E58225